MEKRQVERQYIMKYMNFHWSKQLKIIFKGILKLHKNFSVRIELKNIYLFISTLSTVLDTP